MNDIRLGRSVLFHGAVATLATALFAGCASRNYTYYLVEPDTKTQEVFEEKGSYERPFRYGTDTVMKVRWNDGNLLTEIDIPMLSTGQRVVIEHAKGGTGVNTIPDSGLLPPPPTAADRAMVDAYRSRGLKIDDEQPDISIVRARENMQRALERGSYALALEWVEMVLARYPSHPEFLRAKASVLLMMGEKPKAIEIYERAEEIDSDPSVEKLLEKLQSEEN